MIIIKTEIQERRMPKHSRRVNLALASKSKDLSLKKLSLVPATPTTPFYADVQESASRALHDHIKAHDNYFPAERSSSDWVDFMKEELGGEWDEYIARHQKHKDECEALAEEIEDIQEQIARENRIQCTRFMMAVKEKNRASQKKRLVEERDRLNVLKETNQKSWRDMLNGVASSKEKDVFGEEPDVTMVAEMDEGGPLSS